VGIGFLLDTETKLSEFVWHNRFTRRSVDKFVVRGEWNVVKKLPHGPAYGAGWYRKFTALDIQEIKINLALESKLRRLHTDLRWQFKNRLGIVFDTLPAPVQEALFDMGWNLGAGFLSGKKVNEEGETVDAWPELRKAIRAGNWLAAAVESRRGKVSAARNLEIHGLFMRAIDEPAPRIHEFGDEPE
jgi:GH24 family phage-related lysozyme (muramidase)